MVGDDKEDRLGYQVAAKLAESLCCGYELVICPSTARTRRYTLSAECSRRDICESLNPLETVLECRAVIRNDKAELETVLARTQYLRASV